MRDRRFVLLWLAMLVSSTGTFMLLLALSSSVLRQRGMAAEAASIFASQWVLPVIAASLVRRCAERPDLRRTVVISELGAAILSLGVGVHMLADMRSIGVMLVLFAVRGLCEAITKTARVVMVKRLFHGEFLRLASTTFNLSYFVGGVLGGICGSLLVGRVDIFDICAIDAFTFVVSAACYACISGISRHGGATIEPAAKRNGTLIHAWRIARSHPDLLRALGYQIAAGGIFQGFHNAARTLLPIRELRMSDESAMQLQIASGLAIVFGALAVTWMGSFVAHRRFAVLIHALTTVSMLLAAQSTQGTLFLLYPTFIFLFEVAFTTGQSLAIQHCRTGDMASISVATNAVGTGLLVACTLFGGWLADRFGFNAATWAIATVSIAVATLIEIGAAASQRRHSPSVQESRAA